MTARTTRRFTGRIAPHILLVILCVYFLLPIYWLIIASTKDNSGLFTGSGGSLWVDDHFALFDNVVALFQYGDGIYLRWMGNSLLYAVGGGVGATAVAILAGYAFAKFDFPGRKVGFGILLGSIMIPTTALVIPTFALLASMQLTNTIWAVILPSLLSPIGVYLMRVYAEDAVPDELLEAARIDGAGELRILFTIAVPLLRPAIVTVLLLAVVGTWNNFFLPLAVLTSPELLPVTVGLQGWQSQSAGAAATSGQLWSLVVTGSLISIIPLVAAFLSMQKYWRGGLSLGALK